jgi:hypothetical protein
VLANHLPVYRPCRFLECIEIPFPSFSLGNQIDGPHINAFTFLGSQNCQSWAPPDRVTRWLEGKQTFLNSATRFSHRQQSLSFSPLVLVHLRVTTNLDEWRILKISLPFAMTGSTETGGNIYLTVCLCSATEKHGRESKDRKKMAESDYFSHQLNSPRIKSKTTILNKRTKSRRPAQAMAPLAQPKTWLFLKIC